jgi:drug/metabolite transporter (DMT)-like permease
VLLLDERLGVIGVLGLSGVVGGILLITMGPRLLGRGVDPEATATLRRRRGVYWGAATGALIAGYTVLDGYAVKMLAVSPLLLDYCGNVLRVPMQLPVVLRNRASFRAEMRRTWKGVLAVATISPLAYVLVLLAVREAPLSRVAPAREVSMLFAALLGGQLLGEGERGWRLAGAALIGAGVIALAI